jgi:hypothetical protein
MLTMYSNEYKLVSRVGDAERLYKCIDEHKALLADRRPIVDECDANESNQRFRLVQYDPEKHKDE